MQKHRRRLATAAAGISGVAVILLGALITALAYEGREGQAYRFWNHFVSELGEVGVSRLASVFNGSLILGGVGIIIFMIGLTRLIPGWFRYVFAVAGLATGISGTLVGFFPMNRLQPHIQVAMQFFNMGLLAMTLFSLYVLFARQRTFPRWFVVPGILATACFAAFLYLPTPNDVSGGIPTTQALVITNRPEVWWLSIMEWSAVLAVLGWVLLVSLYLWIQARKVPA
ncbi:MAG: DUF998 domain-containing protein [Anaerolineae bacterium]|nr:DUF998 domain-containing protein [Anaerolineae bacterium]